MQPHAIITPLKAIRMLLNGSAVLVRAERWEEITMPARKSRWQQEHATCQETITRQRTEIESLASENAYLRALLEPLEAWASHVLSIVKDRRIPSAEVIADGEAIAVEARAVL